MQLSNTSRAVVAACCAVLALLASGCGTEPKVDRTLYLAVPLSGPLAKRGADMAHAAVLSLDQAHNDTKTTRLKLKVVDSANRTAISATEADSNSLAVIGGISIDGVRAISKVLSATQLLQVGLAPAPTQATGAPARTGNVIWQLPSAPGEGDALAQFVSSIGQKQIGFFTDQGAFGNSLKPGFLAGVNRSGMKFLGTEALGSDEPVVGAGNRSGFVQADEPLNAPASSPHTLVTAGMTADSYPPAGERFFKTFKKEFGHEPDRFAIYAYEATGLVLDAIQRVEKAGKTVSRAAVTDQAFTIKNRFGPVGHYDVLPSGRTSLYIFQARGGDAPTGPASLIEAQR